MVGACEAAEGSGWSQSLRWPGPRVLRVCAASLGGSHRGLLREPPSPLPGAALRWHRQREAGQDVPQVPGGLADASGIFPLASHGEDHTLSRWDQGNANNWTASPACLSIPWAIITALRQDPPGNVGLPSSAGYRGILSICPLLAYYGMRSERLLLAMTTILCMGVSCFDRGYAYLKIQRPSEQMADFAH